MDNILDVKNLTKMFGHNIPAALKMQKAGAGKEEIF
jgi:ABC-type proline/glycine betaine transport system ATPase subunit